MKLTRSVGYALGVLMRVEQESRNGAPLTAARIAKGSKFPPRYLYRVLRRLVDAGIMTGVSGPGGGYALARSAQKITLLQIVLAVEGDVDFADLVPVNGQQKKAIAQVNRVLHANHQHFQRSLKRVTLAKLLDA